MTVLQEGARTGKHKLLWGINRPNESDLECIVFYTNVGLLWNTNKKMQNLPLNFRWSFQPFIIHVSVLPAMGFCGATVRQAHSPSGVSAVNWWLCKSACYHIPDFCFRWECGEGEKVTSADGNLKAFLGRWVWAGWDVSMQPEQSVRLGRKLLQLAES